MNYLKGKCVVIFNPASDKGNTAKLLPVLTEIIDGAPVGEDLEIILKKTDAPNHASEIVKEFGASADTIISVGGDGTINEIINGINMEDPPFLGIIPVGSGNDFAANINSFKNIPSFFDHFFNGLFSIREVDIGRVNFIRSDDSKSSHRFINAVGTGFDAFVAHTYRKITKIKGTAAYILAVIKALKNLIPLKIKLVIDEKIFKGKFLLVSIGNGKRSGGGFYLNPAAEIDDNYLDLTILESVGKLKILMKIPKALINKLQTVKEASFHRLKSCRLKIDPGYYVHADGEILGDDIKQLDVSMFEKKLKVLTAN